VTCWLSTLTAAAGVVRSAQLDDLNNRQHARVIRVPAVNDSCSRCHISLFVWRPENAVGRENCGVAGSEDQPVEFARTAVKYSTLR